MKSMEIFNIRSFYSKHTKWLEYGLKVQISSFKIHFVEEFIPIHPLEIFWSFLDTTDPYVG